MKMSGKPRLKTTALGLRTMALKAPLAMAIMALNWL